MRQFDVARPRQPIFNAPPGAMGLCVGLVAIFILLRLLPQPWLEFVLANFGLIPSIFMAQFTADGGGVSVGGLLPIVTHMLLHYDWAHVLINAGILLAFGSLIERVVGTVPFVIFFTLCGIGGAIAQLWLAGPVFSLLLGASGGVYGAIGGAVPILFGGRAGPVFRRAFGFVAVIMGINLLFGILDMTALTGGAAIAWQDHIGGFVTGLVLMPFLLARRR